MPQRLQDVQRVIPNTLHVVEHIDVKHLGFHAFTAGCHTPHGLLAERLTEAINGVFQLISGLHVWGGDTSANAGGVEIHELKNDIREILNLIGRLGREFAFLAMLALGQHDETVSTIADILEFGDYSEHGSYLEHRFTADTAGTHFEQIGGCFDGDTITLFLELLEIFNSNSEVLFGGGVKEFEEPSHQIASEFTHALHIAFGFRDIELTCLREKRGSM